MLKYLFDERGVNEIASTALVLLFGLVVAGVAFVAIDPPLDTGIQMVTSRISSTFNTIAGL